MPKAEFTSKLQDVLRDLVDQIETTSEAASAALRIAQDNKLATVEQLRILENRNSKAAQRRVTILQKIDDLL